MLAVALNYIGVRREEGIGAAFMQVFKDFKMVRLFPDSDSGEGQLQLCQPQKYEDLVEDVDQSWDSSESRAELRGTKDKLLRMARQMFFSTGKNIIKRFF